jgi:hypothetical protein
LFMGLIHWHNHHFQQNITEIITTFIAITDSIMKIVLLLMGLLSSLLACGQNNTKKVIIPEDKFAVVTSTDNGTPAVIVVNTSLRKFKPKDVFGWSCSLVIQYKDLAENGMPTSEESEFVYQYLEGLSKQIIGDPSHPNALYLARVTWNGTCEVIWQVNNPEPVNEFLKGIIENESYPREFDYKMEYDAKWDNVSWFLQKFK